MYAAREYVEAFREFGEPIDLCGQVEYKCAKAAMAALAQLSLFAASADSKSLILNDVHINSLHYRAYVLVAATGDGRAVIFGGGCAGKVRRKWSSSRRCSGSGWV